MEGVTAASKNDPESCAYRTVRVAKVDLNCRLKLRSYAMPISEHCDGRVAAVRKLKNHVFTPGYAYWKIGKKPQFSHCLAVTSTPLPKTACVIVSFSVLLSRSITFTLSNIVDSNSVNESLCLRAQASISRYWLLASSRQLEP